MGDYNPREVRRMDDRLKSLLARVLDMDETELRAAMIAVVNGISVDEAIDAAYNVFWREAAKLRFPRG